MTKRALLTASLMLLAIGCGASTERASSGESNRHPEFDAVIQAFMDFRNALLDRDEEAFVSCVDGREAEIEFYRSMFRIGRAVQNFREKVDARFGPEIADELCGQQDPIAFMANDVAMVGEDDLVIDIRGDTAMCQLKERPDTEPLRLAKKDERWRVVLEAPADPANEDATMIAPTLIAMSEIWNDMAERVDDEGMDPERLKHEMEMKMAAFAMRMMATQEAGAADPPPAEE